MKHGCIIVHRANIVSRGHNSNETSNYNKYSVHAEVAAINQMNKNRTNTESMVMYVVRINNKDLDKENTEIRTMNSKPCLDCMKCITYHKLKKVYFTSIDSIY
jgi:tRNA(Arg) A34 adenosine deaminase TadA